MAETFEYFWFEVVFFSLWFCRGSHSDHWSSSSNNLHHSRWSTTYGELQGWRSVFLQSALWVNAIFMLILCLYGLLHCDFLKIRLALGFFWPTYCRSTNNRIYINWYIYNKYCWNHWIQFGLALFYLLTCIIISGEENDTTNKFILTAQSDTLTLRTARPPDPPSNLSIAASTCNALRLVWDPPVEHGVEIIGKLIFIK